MKIRLLTSMAGLEHSAKPGDVLDVPQAEALSQIEQGNAVPVVETETEMAIDKRAKNREKR